MILADTSVWVEHLRKGVAQLKSLLIDCRVFMHPFVIGELACGNLHNRQELLTLWSNLPAVSTASDSEVLYFIEQKRLMGKGIGYVDAHILASVALSAPARLWTRDKRLDSLAARLGLAVSLC